MCVFGGGFCRLSLSPWMGPPGSGQLSAARPNAGGPGAERAPQLSIGRAGLHHVSLIKDALCLLLLLLLGRGRLEERGEEGGEKKQTNKQPPETLRCPFILKSPTASLG